MRFRRPSDPGSGRTAVPQFPSTARQRLGFGHPDLTADHLRAVEEAARQWFRLAERQRPARLAMPSVAVDELWRVLTEQRAGLPPYVPEQPATGDHGKRLQHTFRLAQRDEGCASDALPLLFRVDREIGIAGGRRYLVDCGGRGQCFPVAATICLVHLTGPGKPVRGDWKGPDSRMDGWDSSGMAGGNET
jgi:hypothetical protein